MILGSGQLGSLGSQFGVIGWILFSTTIAADPHLILLVGSYLTTIDVAGEYDTTIEFVGDIEIDS